MWRLSCQVFAVSLFMNIWMAAGQPPEKRKDAQSTYEPRSAPGAGQKYLETFVGEWDVTKTFYPSAGEPARAKGECRQTMIHEGRFLQSEFVFVQDGRKSTGLGLVGFDSGKASSRRSGRIPARRECRCVRARRPSMEKRSSCSAARSRTRPRGHAGRGRSVSWTPAATGSFIANSQLRRMAKSA